LQREDLNPVDRAWAFMRLHSEFGFTHAEIGKEDGEVSRIRFKQFATAWHLPQDIMVALSRAENHRGTYATTDDVVRSSRGTECTLFKEIMIKKVVSTRSRTVTRVVLQKRRLARKNQIAFNPEIANYEERLAESLWERAFILNSAK
jgi:hypothetical protein